MLGWCTTARFLHGLQRNILYVTKMHFVFDPRSMLACWKESPFWHSQTLRLFNGHITSKSRGNCEWLVPGLPKAVADRAGAKKEHDTSAYYVHLYVLDVTFHSTVCSHSAVWFLQHLTLRGSSAYCICRLLVSQSRGCTERSLWAFVL